MPTLRYSLSLIIFSITWVALYALCMDPVITQQLSYTDFNIERVVNMTIPDK